ncbi:Derlin-2 [Ceratobasidium sp. AG-Ba]|nr:Derlin-2 [Ceratobasidium sp. AG-Ba]QRW10516.1 Derlin-2 [Ceratobasidium sp. AG-Ba]
MDDVRAELMKIPPVTRFLVVSSVAISLPVMMHLISGTWFVYAPYYVLGKMQVWRIISSWLLGPPGIPYIFDLIMLYRASTDLEEAIFGGHSADYAWHLIVSGAAIMILNIPLQTLVFWRPLIMLLVYRSAKANPDGQVSLFGLVSIKNAYFPFVLLVFDLINGGPGALVQSLTGVVASHAWFLLFPEPGLLRSAPTAPSAPGVRTFGGSSTFTLSGGRPAAPTSGAQGWRKWAVAPRWVRWLVGGMHEAPTGGSEGRSWGTASVAPRGHAQAPAASGHKWGSGNRLGSE